MNGIESINQSRREGTYKRRRRAVKVSGRAAAAAICLLAGSISCWAGYVIDSHVERGARTNRYTWTVYNEDQAWGLDGFAIEVPVQTRILARTVPAPYSDADHTGYWVMEERYEAWVDPHDGRVAIPAPRPGMKLLWWWAWNRRAFNYKFVAVNAESVLWVLDRFGYGVTPDVKRILAVFHGPDCTLESAVSILAEVTKRIWLQSTLYHHKIDFLDAALDSLTTNRPTNQVAELFKITIQAKLFLVPSAVEAIERRIGLWKEHRLGRVGLLLPRRSGA